MAKILKSTIIRRNVKSDYEEHRDIMDSQIINDKDMGVSVCMGCYKHKTLNGLGLCEDCQGKVDRGEIFGIPDEY